MGFTNSPLATYKRLSPNYTGPRRGQIKIITIHCVVGQVTIERLGEIFANPQREASSNYGIDKDGRIGLFVEECNRSWCSGGRDKNGNIIRVNGVSGADNDHEAVTIEVASDTTSPYAVTNKAYESLIMLVADICKRNHIEELRWRADKSLVGKPELQNMTVHRWFANKSCPGDYLYNRMGDIAASANTLLKNNVPVPPDHDVTKEVSVTYDDINIGDILNFKGTTNYSTSGSTKPVAAKPCTCKVTNKTKQSAKHPVHVRAIKSDGSFTSGVYGWVNIEDLTRTVVVEDITPEFPYKVRITASSLRVRSGPGQGYKHVTSVKQGEVYTIVDEIDGWGKLKSGRGYICLSYTEPF